MAGGTNRIETNQLRGREITNTGLAYKQPPTVNVAMTDDSMGKQPDGKKWMVSWFEWKQQFSLSHSFRVFNERVEPDITVR